MVLRCPNTLIDNSLLQDEPFKSHFARRDVHKESRRQTDQARSSYHKFIRDEMCSDPLGLDAAVLWLVNALTVTADEAREPALLDVFIEFHWLLYRNSPREAVSFLNKTCKDRNTGYFPDFRKILTNVPAPTTSSRRKRRKQGQGEAYTADVEDNTSDGNAVVPYSSRHASLRPRSLSDASAAPVPPTEQSVPQDPHSLKLAPQSISAPAMRGGTDVHSMVCTAHGSSKGKKRRSKKHGASSASASSAEDTSTVKTATASGRTSVLYSLMFGSSSSLSSLPSDNEPSETNELVPRRVSDRSPPPTQMSKKSTEAPEALLEQVQATSEISSLPLSATAALELSTSEPLSAPLNMALPPRTAIVVKKPSRIMPHRQAAHRQHLSDMMATETRYHRRARQGLRDDLDLASSGASVRTEVRAKELVKEPEKAKGLLKDANSTQSNIDDIVHDGIAAQPRTQLPSISCPPPVRQRKVAKKPIIIPDKDSLFIQVAKRRRRNDGAASSVAGGLAQVLMNAAGKQTTETTLPMPVSAPETCLGEPSGTRERSITTVDPKARPEGAGKTKSSDKSQASKPLKSKRGRKRTRAQVEAADFNAASTAIRKSAKTPSTRVTVPLRRSTRARPVPAGPTTPLVAFGSPMSTTLAIADTILRDAATESYQTLTCPVEAASEWEADKPDDHAPAHSDCEDDAIVRNATAEKAKLSTGNASHEDEGHETQAIEKQLPEAQAEEVERQLQEPGSMRNTSGETVTSSQPRLVVYSHQGASCEPTSGKIKIAATLELPDSEDAPPKLPLKDYPPIWAESRQEVCESFDWFRNYQGGVYSIKGQVKGYLLGGFSASRDIFYNNGMLIISHGGGKAESLHKHNGQLESQEASDQMEDDKSVRALLQTYRTRRPVVLLIDDKYKPFPFDLGAKGCTYAVLGWYYIAHAWAEYQSASNATGQVVRYKFAFQWCEGQESPWWITSSPRQGEEYEPDVDAEPSSMSGSTRQKCQRCNVSSPAVYEQGWMCLKPECKAFWTLKDGADPPEHLTYSKAFLRPLSFPINQLENLYPSLPGADVPTDGVTTTRHFCKGWHCRNCGRLSSRFKWENWECRACGAQFGEYGRLRTALEFRHQTTAKTFDRHWSHGSLIQAPYEYFPCEKGIGTRATFILPYGRGRIHLLLSHPLANRTADTILVKYQEEALSGVLKFRRWPLRTHKCRGTLLTNYFSQNTGEPYQYVGGSAKSVPFEESPQAVMEALELIKTRMKQASLNLEVPFNEVLSAAYMEEQKMAFHSDSERGLGPVVASLSLGASAYMYFRLHSRYSSELEDDTGRDVLKLFLRHGDVVVMEGAGVQTFYEHTVVPLNFRIAATVRYIGSDHH